MKTLLGKTDRYKLVVVYPDGTRRDSLLKGADMLSKREANHVLKTRSKFLADGGHYEIEKI